MENNIVSSGSEFKHKSRESSSSRDENSSNTSNSWNDKEHRRDHGKERERGRDSMWLRENFFNGKNRETIREEENRDRFRDDHQQQQQQSATLPTYGYTAGDHSFADANRRALTMMNYNFMAAMGSHWGVNPMDGVALPQNNPSVNASQPAMLTGGLEVNQNSGATINPYAYMGMPGDPNMYGMMGMGNYCQYGLMGGQESTMINIVKETLKLTNSTLIPPNPNAPPPRTNPKPVGCKTVYAGYFPEKITDEIIKEIFERCGEIDAVRINEVRNNNNSNGKQYFCHVQFRSEASVDNALYFSGYKIKIEHKDESGYTGRFHVDYAQSKQDQRDYECQQRALEREARHRQRLESDYCQPPTPPPIAHYSDHEAAALIEKLRGEDTFQNACLMLNRWLQRGECNKRNAGTFYSMIQSTNSHVRRLINEKSKYEEELTKAKKMLQNQMQGILLQFNDISKVFNAACLQKVWDQFTKAQRKNIELWKKQTEEIKNAHVEEVLNDRVEDEMEVSDDEGECSDNATKKLENSLEQQISKLQEEIRKLQEENDTLRCQIKGVENEIEVIQRENAQMISEKDNEISQLNFRLSLRQSVDDTDVTEFRPVKYRRCENGQDKGTQTDFDSGVSANCNFTSSQIILEREARIIGVVSAFLQVHPFGANLDYICSYLHMIDPTIKSEDLVNLLRRYPTVFREDSTGIGATLGKVWKFLGFNS